MEHEDGIHQTAEGHDNDLWLKLMKERLLSDEGPFHEEHLICRVHHLLRKENASAYEPICASIGPYHACPRKEHLQAMEAHKRRYLRHLFSRSTENPENRFENLVKMIREKEEQVRACYQEHIPLSSYEFIELVLLDGCFVIGLLTEDLVIGPSWIWSILAQRDLLLLENQLPFFILRDIFQTLFPDQSPLELVRLSCRYLEYITPELSKSLSRALNSVHHLLHLWHTLLTARSTTVNGWRSVTSEEPEELVVLNENVMPVLKENFSLRALNPARHLLRFSHTHFTGSSSMFKGCKPATSEKSEQLTVWMPSATMLQQAGIKFRVGSKNLLNIVFLGKVMKIPRLIVHEYTEIHLRNLTAFEQCCLEFRLHCFTAYVTFMDCLVNTSKDVQILFENGILIHELGSDKEVAKLFNNLRKGLIIDYHRNYLCEMFRNVREVNEYSNGKWCKLRASFMRTYFYNPWAALSLAGALLGLFLTAVQTVLSVVSCTEPRKL